MGSQAPSSSKAPGYHGRSAQAQAPQSMASQSLAPSHAPPARYSHRSIAGVVTNHRCFTQPLELLPLPQSLLPQSYSSALKFSSSSRTKLPQYHLSSINNLVDPVGPKEVTKRVMPEIDQTIVEIANQYKLRSQSQVERVVLGQETFQYSQQTLNKQRIHNRIQAKQLKHIRTALVREAEVDLPVK